MALQGGSNVTASFLAVDLAGIHLTADLTKERLGEDFDAAQSAVLSRSCRNTSKFWVRLLQAEVTPSAARPVGKILVHREP